MTRSFAVAALCSLLAVLPAMAQDTGTWQSVLEAQVESLRTTPPSALEVLAAPQFANTWSQSIQQRYAPSFQGQGDIVPTYDVDISAGLDALASADDDAFSPDAPVTTQFEELVRMVQANDPLIRQLTPEDIARQFAISQALTAGGRNPKIEFCIYIIWCP